ncbi:MAG: hypothetical protein SF051_01185 [Elusimicrobiota bacterium]|nr:hypothetical protein [Elusimicrobiota bacterium]
MKPLFVALLAGLALPATANDPPRTFEDTTSSPELNRRIRENSEEMRRAVSRWEAEFLERVARVESACLASPALSGKSCERAGGPPPHSPSFAYDPDRAFDRAERLYPAAELMRTTRHARATMAQPGFWGAVIDVAVRSLITDPEGANADYRQFAGVQQDEALERARQRYEALKRRARETADSRGLDAQGRVALATCVSANGFSDYNQAEADAVKDGTADPLVAARLPWQSFATNFAPRQTGRGVCRDYAAVARDFLREMGVASRVVGSVGHAMTEVSLPGEEALIVEPQFDNLNGDCRLFRYAR